MFQITIAPALPTIPREPDTAALYDHIIALGMLADSINDDGRAAVAPLGYAVQLAAMCTIADAPLDMPIDAADPVDVLPWLRTHGEIADDASAGGGVAYVEIGELVPTVASMLAMTCPAELEIAIWNVCVMISAVSVSLMD